MFKKLPAVVNVLIIVLVVIFALILLLRQRAVPMAAVLPGKCDFYWRVKGLTRGIDDFSETAFWSKLKGIQLRRALEKAGASFGDLASFDRFFGALFSPSSEAIVKKFFGKDMAVAVYLPEPGSPAGGLPGSASSVIVVTRLKNDARFVDLLASLWSVSPKDIEHRTRSYKNRRIHLLKSRKSGLEIGYTRIGDCLVLGMGDQAARRCVDVLKKSRKPLSKDPFYLKAKTGFMENADVTGYINVGTIAAWLKKDLIDRLAVRAPKEAASIRDVMGKNIDQVFGFRQIGYSGLFSPFLRLRFDLYYESDHFDPSMRSYYSCKGKTNQTLSFVPRDVLAYQWGTCHDFAYYWEEAKKGMSQPDKISEEKMSPMEAMASLEKKANLSIEKDVIPVLGDEFGYALADINTDGLVPVPGILFFVKVRDAVRGAGIVETIMNQLALVHLESENYKNHNISFFLVPLIQGLQPGYTFLDQYLLLSTRRSLLQRAVDNLQHPDEALGQTSDFQDEALGLAGENKSVLFVDVERLAGKLDALVDWGNHWMDVQQEKQEAFRMGQLKYLKDVRRDTAAAESRLVTLKREMETFDREQEGLLQFESQTEDIRQRLREMEASPPAPEDQEAIDKQERLRNQLEDLTARAQQLKPIRAKMDTLQEDARKLREQIASNHQKEAEITRNIEMFKDSRTIPPVIRRTIVTDLIKPLLKAMGDITMFADRMVAQKGFIEGNFYLKVR